MQWDSKMGFLLVTNLGKKIPYFDTLLISLQTIYFPCLFSISFGRSLISKIISPLRKQYALLECQKNNKAI